MSATSRGLEVTENVADRERRRAAEMTIGRVSAHIRQDTWPSRVSTADVGPLEAWRKAEAVHYPSARRSVVARFHVPTETIMLARQGALMTCIPLPDRSPNEQQYVRSQVTDL